MRFNIIQLCMYRVERQQRWPGLKGNTKIAWTWHQEVPIGSNRGLQSRGSWSNEPWTDSSLQRRISSGCSWPPCQAQTSKYESVHRLKYLPSVQLYQGFHMWVIVAGSLQCRFGLLNWLMMFDSKASSFETSMGEQRWSFQGFWSYSCSIKPSP